MKRMEHEADVAESVPTHAGQQKPTLKSKLLFMDHRFHKLAPGTLSISPEAGGSAAEMQFKSLIIRIGRTGCQANDVEVPAGGAVSRRHCLIVNCKDDAWIYDLGSTGTFLDNRQVRQKEPLVGLSTIRIGGRNFVVSTDKEKLL